MGFEMRRCEHHGSKYHGVFSGINDRNNPFSRERGTCVFGLFIIHKSVLYNKIRVRITKILEKHFFIYYFIAKIHLIVIFIMIF